jgi:hypothetical protein
VVVSLGDLAAGAEGAAVVVAVVFGASDSFTIGAIKYPLREGLRRESPLRRASPVYLYMVGWVWSPSYSTQVLQWKHGRDMCRSRYGGFAATGDEQIDERGGADE